LVTQPNAMPSEDLFYLANLVELCFRWDTRKLKEWRLWGLKILSSYLDHLDKVALFYIIEQFESWVFELAAAPCPPPLLLRLLLWVATGFRGHWWSSGNRCLSPKAQKRQYAKKSEAESAYERHIVWLQDLHEVRLFGAEFLHDLTMHLTLVAFFSIFTFLHSFIRMCSLIWSIIQLNPQSTESYNWIRIFKFV
jgi:hypothetical protein